MAHQPMGTPQVLLLDLSQVPIVNINELQNLASVEEGLGLNNGGESVGLGYDDGVPGSVTPDSDNGFFVNAESQSNDQISSTSMSTGAGITTGHNDGGRKGNSAMRVYAFA